MQNQSHKIAVVELSKDLSSGAVANTLTSPALDPLTLADVDGTLYAVNARFSTESDAGDRVRSRKSRAVGHLCWWRPGTPLHKFHHRGGTQGYRAYLGASAKGGYGVAVMANGEDAASLLNEVLGAVFEVGGWPAAQRPVVRPVTLDLAPYVGTYRYRFEVFSHTLSLYAEGGSLWATSPSLWVLASSTTVLG